MARATRRLGSPTILKACGKVSHRAATLVRPGTASRRTTATTTSTSTAATVPWTSTAAAKAKRAAGATTTEANVASSSTTTRTARAAAASAAAIPSATIASQQASNSGTFRGKASIDSSKTALTRWAHLLAWRCSCPLATKQGKGHFRPKLILKCCPAARR